MSVHLSVPPIDRCNSVRRCGPSRQQISIDCCTNGAAVARRSTAISSRREQCHVDSRRVRLSTDLRAQATLTGNTLPTELDLLRLYFVRPRPRYVVDHTGRVRSNDPLHPVTFGRGGAESYAAVATLSVPGEGRPLSLMVRTTADGLVAYSGAGQRADFLALELVDAGQLRLVAGPAAAVVSAAGSLADGRWHTVELAVEQVPAAGGRRSRHRRATPTRALLTMLVDNRPVQAASLVNTHTHTHTHTPV